MLTDFNIQYLEQHQLNRLKWDQCIATAANGVVYAYSDFLDHMATQWGALVLNDYEAVMPLPWRKKMGISYIYQPFLTAQLGLFGNNISEQLLTSFLEHIPKKFKLWEFPLNAGNVFSNTGYPLYQRMNYVLPLNKPYATLQNAYRENSTRNIKKARQYGCYKSRDTSIAAVLNLAIEQNGPDKGFNDFEKLFGLYAAKGLAKCYGVYSDKQQLLSSCALLYSHNRLYYLLVGNHPNGRTLGASHLLIDAIIRDHAEQNLVLDFEGSDIRNLAFFYSSFGAKEEVYAAIRMNRLPWYAKWLKKN